ncbi:sialate O-acetylesterase [Reichenbachiella sp. 5M10]|uniref:sialate O-acetylesterase n=1 Tax=Reichenbachiella sp. 5M10 TaxID=1889772 RepID=UPI0026C31386
MMKKHFILSLLLLFILFGVSQAEIRLPKLVSNGMVLQRDTPLKIWGWADPSEDITVRFKGKKYTTTTSATGEWSVTMRATKAGGPYTMQIQGKDDSITLSNLLVGDVWMCAGQSNMVHYLGVHQQRYRQEIAEANYPEIRQFLVPTNPQLQGTATDIPQGEWKEANPENVLKFSVVAYFFAKNLYDQYQVPIGLINASVGGTPIEAWISEEGFEPFPSITKTLTQNKDTAYVNQKNRIAQKYRAAAPPQPQDDGLTASTPWYDLSYKPTHWHNINIPGYWEDQGIRNLDGAVWYRREIDIPASMTGVATKIFMGRIIDADQIYINGTQVGGKTYKYPQRIYDIPVGLLKTGKNLITIRVVNYGGKGGFVPDKPYYLATENDTLDLKGTWQYKVSQVFRPKAPQPSGVSAQHQPTALYNGMVVPFTQSPIKGIVWYQGESNGGNPQAYEKLMETLIQDWRTKWNDSNLPFLYAQLPDYMDVDYLPTESNWAELREAQRLALDVPNTAMAVTLGLGEWNDVHPDNKKPVGDRLALAAKALAYDDKKVVYSGPMFRSASVEGSQVTLSFDHVGSGLISQDGEALRWFALAGVDQNYVWADAKIENNQIVLSSDEINQPIYVRYAWQDNPMDVNFYNQEGLPASPFQTQLTDALWFGKKATVVLTYDDALNVHLDNALPVLDSLGLKATFYISADAPGFKYRTYEWKKAAQNGHELGNHTLYHPCLGGDGRAWVSDDNDLRNYSVPQMVREIDMTNLMLQTLDGKSKRTYAYTCGDKETGEGSFVKEIEGKFVALRGVQSGLNHLGTLDMTDLRCNSIVDTPASDMIAWAEQAKKENAMLILLFHGVGGEHSLNAALADHKEFLEYLQANKDDLWITTLEDAAKHILKQQKK